MCSSSPFSSHSTFATAPQLGNNSQWPLSDTSCVLFCSVLRKRKSLASRSFNIASKNLHREAAQADLSQTYLDLVYWRILNTKTPLHLIITKPYKSAAPMINQTREVDFIVARLRAKTKFEGFVAVLRVKNETRRVCFVNMHSGYFYKRGGLVCESISTNPELQTQTSGLFCFRCL